ncbi:MAG: glycosyltransferase 87 family protein, partial [Actinomycetota bacterium]|nr:glycosyltransferase 87 family protein [Actinomycetota bacterium]
MSTRSESWSRPADPPSAWLAALAAVVVLVGSWVTLHYGFYAENDIVDTPVYEGYGDRIAAGDVPYRDFELEYPPGALPVFAAPALVDAELGVAHDFRSRFELLMLACAAAMLGLMALVLRTVGATPARLAAGLAFAAVAPLALGSVVLTRFDFWPAALTVAALAALVAGRERLGLGVLGLGVAAKIYPGALVPLALAYAWKRHGRREALVCLGVFAAVLAACVVPFVVLSPDGVWASAVRQMTRPLQIESLGSGFLLALHHLAGLELTMESTYGSQNLTGARPELIGVVQSALQVGALLAVWAWFARGPATRERLVQA